MKSEMIEALARTKVSFNMVLARDRDCDPRWITSIGVWRFGTQCSDNLRTSYSQRPWNEFVGNIVHRRNARRKVLHKDVATHCRLITGQRRVVRRAAAHGLNRHTGSRRVRINAMLGVMPGPNEMPRDPLQPRVMPQSQFRAHVG